MPSDAALPSVQQHAKDLTAALIKEGKIAHTTDPDAAAAATLVPAFSKGTRAIDPNTGEPITETPDQPEFSPETVAPPEDTETTGTPAKGVTPKPQQPPAKDEGVTPRERDPKTGQFVGEQTPAQEAGTQAAEEVAAQLPDIWADAEDFEFEDPDLNIKIPIKFPKQYAASVKRGYPRRADYDRIRTRWGDAAPVIEPLLQDGRFARIVPLIQRALNDQAYGDYVWQGFERSQQGQPLVQVPRETAPVQPPISSQVQPGEQGFVDPLLEAALNPVLSRLSEFEKRFQTQDQQQQEAARRQQQNLAQQTQTANTLLAAHRDLESMYPSEYKTSNGPTDQNWQRACKYASDAGYIEAYGLRGGIIFGAQQLAIIEGERLAATASPAAAALASVDQKQVELARQQAAQTARSAGGGAPHQTAPPPPKAKPSTKRADGGLKSAEEYMQEMASFLQTA